MPDLGKYADAVLGSYAVTIVLLVALIGHSIWRGRRVRRQLAEIQARNGK